MAPLKTTQSHSSAQVDPNAAESISVPKPRGSPSKTRVCKISRAGLAGSSPLKVEAKVPFWSPIEPPRKVRRKEIDVSHNDDSPAKNVLNGKASGSEESPLDVTFSVPRNFEIIAGELEYFCIYGLPFSLSDQNLKRIIKTVLKKAVSYSSFILILPEVDCKIALLYSGSSEDDRKPRKLTLKRLKKKLKSDLFLSKFPNSTNFDKITCLSSNCPEYLFKWTRLYFCPLSISLAEETQCQHLLVSNLSESLLCSPGDLLVRFSTLLPSARSFFLPVDETEDPVNYMLVRFSNSEDCISNLKLMRDHYSLEMSPISLLETCKLPGNVEVPCHNLLNWCYLDRTRGMSIELDDPRTPFVCTCHPQAETIAPVPEKLHSIAERMLDSKQAFKSLVLRYGM